MKCFRAKLNRWGLHIGVPLQAWSDVQGDRSAGFKFSLLNIFQDVLNTLWSLQRCGWPLQRKSIFTCWTRGIDRFHLENMEQDWSQFEGLTAQIQGWEQPDAFMEADSIARRSSFEVKVIKCMYFDPFVGFGVLICCGKPRWEFSSIFSLSCSSLTSGAFCPLCRHKLWTIRQSL
jgi:hypothetical protein